MLQEVAKGWRVNLPNAAFASELLQEAVDDWLMQIDKCQAVPVKPPFEVAQEPQLHSHCRSGIAQLAARGDKRVQVRAKQATPQPFYGRAIREYVLQHTSSPFWLIVQPQRKGHPAYAASPTRQEKPNAVEDQVASESSGIIRQSALWRLCRSRHNRHTFAVHRLIQWYQEGADVQRLLPHLSVYLGHRYLVSTQVYLSMTPELLQEAGSRFENYACGEGRHD